MLKENARTAENSQSADIMDPAAPNSPFKWETASGLEHSCYACSMKMSNPKARQTCYGTHSIPCSRYHQTMHAIGTSHNCFSCIQADELHENRHRKIAELLMEYKAATGINAGTPPTRPRLEELPVNVPHAQQAVREFDFELGADLDNGELADEENNHGHDTDDVDTVTETTGSTMDESERHHMGSKMTKAETRAMKKASKAAKSQSKAVKNQKKHIVNVRAETVAFVAEVLHGDAANSDGATHPLASDKNIEEVIARNMGFLASIDDHKRTLLSSIAQRRKSDRDRRRSSNMSVKKRRFSERGQLPDDEEDDEMEDLLVAVMIKLGVNGEHARGCGPTIAVAAMHNANAKKNKASNASSAHQVSDIIKSLKALVRDDLERFENEQRETCVRAGGFWRYVGRPVFERMTQIARELDWKTGMKLKEINNNVEREE